MILDSSMIEQRTVNARVPGLSPGRGAMLALQKSWSLRNLVTVEIAGSSPVSAATISEEFKVES